MYQKNILSTVIDEIYKLESYVQGWRDMENVPSIEKDLVQRKLQQIYDLVKHLDAEGESRETKTAEVHHPAPGVSAEPEVSVPGVIQELTFEDTIEIIEEPKSIIHEIPIITGQVKQETMTEPEPKVIEVTSSKVHVETEKTRVASKENLAEKLTQTHKVINETIKTRTVMDVSSKLKAAPITSIQSAINLNDKFLFIRELFKNNNLLYNQTIERLNNAKSSDEALSIIEKEFAWDTTEPLVIKLVELIKRKHNA